MIIDRRGQKNLLGEERVTVLHYHISQTDCPGIDLWYGSSITSYGVDNDGDYYDLPEH
jgi:hypothetical protein